MIALGTIQEDTKVTFKLGTIITLSTTTHTLFPSHQPYQQCKDLTNDFSNSPQLSFELVSMLGFAITTTISITYIVCKTLRPNTLRIYERGIHIFIDG
mgnify:CR=1 FL=1